MTTKENFYQNQCDQVFWNFCSPSRRYLPKNFAQCQKVPKYLHQTNFQTQKYLHQSQFETSKDLHQKEFWNNLCSLKFKKVAVWKISPKIRRFSRRISYLKNSPRPLKSSPNGENSPHQVTLIRTLWYFIEICESYQRCLEILKLVLPDKD